MFSKEKVYLYLIFLITILGNISILLKSGLIFYILKATILLVLIFLALTKLKELKHSNIPLLIIAFFFAFLGGLMIHITLEERLFLVMALCSYALSNLVYTILFYYSFKENPSLVPIKFRWPEIVTTVLFWLVIYLIYPYLKTIFFPALIFSFIGYLSILTALNRRFYVEKKSFLYVITGLFCLFIGDVTSATDLSFSDPIKHVFVFTFNTLSHIFIYVGMVQQFELEVNKN